MSNSASTSAPQKKTWAQMAAAPAPQKQAPVSQKLAPIPQKQPRAPVAKPTIGPSRPSVPVPQKQAPVAQKQAPVAQEQVPIPREQLRAPIAKPAITPSRPLETPKSQGPSAEEIDSLQSLILSNTVPAKAHVIETDTRDRSPSAVTNSSSPSEVSDSQDSPPSTPSLEDSQVQSAQDDSEYVPFRLRHAVPNLQLLKNVKDEENVTFVAIDIEKHIYPLNNSNVFPITEVGVTFWDGKSAAHRVMDDGTWHYIIQEYKNKHNKNVKGGILNHKMEFRGIHKSIFISIKKMGKELMGWIKEEEKTGQVVIVVHGGRSDLVDLATLGCDISHLKVLDTQLIDMALHWERYGNRYGARQQCSLVNLLRENGYVPAANRPFHNAGNDAFYTMTAFSRLMKSMDPEEGGETESEL